MLISQSPNSPGTMLTGLLDQVSPDLVTLQVAVAYTTQGGIAEVIARVAEKLGNQWEGIDKRFITALDYGLTSPTAIEALAGLPNSSVRLANPDCQTAPYRPKGSAFHPKIYLFGYQAHSRMLIGSSNLTQRAFTTNSEGGAVEILEPRQAEALWQALWDEAVPLEDVDLEAYRHWRKTAKPVVPDDGSPSPAPAPPTGTFGTLWQAIGAGFEPENYEHMWVECGAMSSGGSHNQLELPRGGSRFLGFDFNDYSDAHEVIGYPEIVTGVHHWIDRKLTWHGNNMMERMNLPTVAQGGFAYVKKAALFRRMPDGTFQLHVDDWDGPLAIAWRNASEALTSTFALGEKSNRQVGFF